MMMFIFLSSLFNVAPVLLPGVPWAVHVLRADRAEGQTVADNSGDDHLGLGVHYDP